VTTLRQLYFSKAFDTVLYSTILRKLHSQDDTVSNTTNYADDTTIYAHFLITFQLSRTLDSLMSCLSVGFQFWSTITIIICPASITFYNPSRKDMKMEKSDEICWWSHIRRLHHRQACKSNPKEKFKSDIDHIRHIRGKLGNQKLAKMRAVKLYNGFLFKMIDKNGFSEEAKRHNLAMENLTAEREKWGANVEISPEFYKKVQKCVYINEFHVKMAAIFQSQKQITTQSLRTYTSCVTKFFILLFRQHCIELKGYKGASGKRAASGVSLSPTQVWILGYYTRRKLEKVTISLSTVCSNCRKSHKKYVDEETDRDGGNKRALSSITLLKTRTGHQKITTDDDVSYGTRYQKHCTKTEFSPLSRATLFRILNVREASQRKSLYGLDNTAADGSSAFDSMENILNSLQQASNEKISWYEETRKSLRAGKKYLKTDFRVHRKETESPCPDHCRKEKQSDWFAQHISSSLERYDFSEPQYGKDVCDRILCPMKESIRRFCNEGHDVIRAKDMREALQQRPVKGTTSFVNSHEDKGIRIWKAFSVEFGNVTVHKTLPMAKFDLGERTGEKADSQQVALDMRNARNEDGDRLFQRDQWFAKNQVKSFFSRLAAARRKNVGTNDSEDDLVSLSEIDDVSGNHWMEELESLEEEQERCSLLEAVESQMGVTHPIIYDTYDLCECNEQNRLNVFKIVMLKEICSTFDIGFKSRETKGMLIAKLKEMLDQCDFITINEVSLQLFGSYMNRQSKAAEDKFKKLWADKSQIYLQIGSRKIETAANVYGDDEADRNWREADR
ncbi:Hypothetical predicted protein, partial [Paramuricea clavata]